MVGETRSLTFVGGIDILDRPYLSLNTDLGDSWYTLTQCPYFVATIYECLFHYVRETFDLADAIIELTTTLKMYVDEMYWCRLEATRYGLDLYNRNDELIESIYCLDTVADDVAW